MISKNWLKTIKNGFQYKRIGCDQLSLFMVKNESYLRLKTQTTIIPFFPLNQKHSQRQCPVKKCIQVC